MYQVIEHYSGGVTLSGVSHAFFLMPYLSYSLFAQHQIKYVYISKIQKAIKKTSAWGVKASHLYKGVIFGIHYDSRR